MSTTDKRSSPRIAAAFETARAQHRSALVPYVTAGFPEPKVALDVMHALVAGGADIIELGVPFSDPSADGPTIQRANDRALAAGVSLADVLELVRAFRLKDRKTPIVLMGYCNPIEAMGIERFAELAADTGVDGVLAVDCPPEEAEPYARALQSRGIDLIYLLAPTSTPERHRQMASIASGYIYYVSLKGVTGAGHLDIDAVAGNLPGIRRTVGLPVGVGFGIKDAATAARVAAFADAVVIGSALIEVLDAGDAAGAAERARIWLRGVRDAVDAVTLSSRNPDI
ncbi:MAG: tryptophan synthase subunit alpha [Lautropia sp.]|nr:tryptophan synthase subunit alpha [Lautropia sp.]